MIRGVDGPGMHILDVLPDSFQGVEGAALPGALYCCCSGCCGACGAMCCVGMLPV